MLSFPGMDELRCDWLVGDGRFGPRRGEIQYTGSANRVPAQLQPPMAYAFIQGHRLANRNSRAAPDAGDAGASAAEAAEARAADETVAVVRAA